MPSMRPRLPRRLRPWAWLCGCVVLGAAVWVGLDRLHSGARAPAASPAAVVTPDLDAAAGTQAVASHPVPPGTAITAEEVLGRMNSWMSAHPNCQSVIETSVFGGGTISRVEVFSFTNGMGERSVRVKADILLPQPVQLQAQNENGKVQVYFPRSGRLLEPDISGMVLSMPGYAAEQSGINTLLKLARNSFAEASADLRVATLALNAESLKLPYLTGDIYLSFRTDLEGKLLGVEQQAQGSRIISKVRYVTFDRELVMRHAPVLPADKVALTGKSLQQAMEEELRLSINKPLRGSRI